MSISKEDLGVLERLRKDLENEKEAILKVWKEIASYIGMAYGDWGKDPNSKKLPVYRNVDTTAANASKILADGVEGYAFSDNMEWFGLEIMSMAENGDEKAARSLLDKATTCIYRMLADADFYDEARSFVRSGADMATACMTFAFDKAKNKFRFNTVHLKDVLPISNEYKEVDSLMRYVYLTKRQAERFFDTELPQAVKDCEDPLKLFTFINFVAPVTDWDFEVNGDGDYLSIWWYENDTERTLKEERISGKNFACWRYSKPIYGGNWGVDSPGMISLPVMHYINLLVEDFVTLGELQAKGHWKKTKGLKVNFKAGGVTDLEAGQDFAYVGAAGDLTWLQAQIEHYREVINANYDTDLFLVLTQNLEKSKTATEVAGIENEKNNLMAAFFTRLAREFLEPVITWAFTTALLYAQIPDLTAEELEQLKDLDIKVQFVSPTYRAQEKAFSLTSSLQWVNDCLGLAQAHPDVLDRIDWDRLIEIDHKIRHAKEELLVDAKAANQARQARANAQAQAMQQQQNMDQSAALGDLYSKLSKPMEQGSAAEALMGGSNGR